MKKTFVLFVTLTLIKLSVSAFEPIRISVITTPNVSPASTRHLNIDVLEPNGTLKTSIITDADMYTEPTGVISLILNNTAWTSYTYSANDLLRISYNSIVLSVERMEVAIAKQSLQGAHYVGELYGGGVVFYVDHTGNHGLICSMVDLSTSQVWSNQTGLIGSTAQSDWDGQSNTNAIIGQSGHNASAAKLCDAYENSNYGTGVFSDWYLPSRGEINHLWNNLFEVQKALDNDGNSLTTIIAKNSYWLSNEYTSSTARSFTFIDGVLGGGNKGISNYVRAIRAF